MHEVDLLVVGGGPVGLTASILLSRLGVTSLLVERHRATSIHPKARAINARTMEIFRQCGVEDAVRVAGLPPERARYIVWARSLAGEELERRIPWRAREEAAQLSPVGNCICAQDDLEPVLRRHAESLGPGKLLFDTELVAFTQDADAAYESAAVVPDGTPPPKVDNAVTDYRPSARPGHRAAHAWLTRAGARLSTLDLFGERFVLLAGPAGGAWCNAARAVSTEHGVELAAFSVGGDSALQDDGDWRELWDIERDGAVLVRPDGQVAWRSRGVVADATAAMRGVLRRVLGHD